MAHGISGIGEFIFKDDYWECPASRICGLPITIDHPDIETGMASLIEFLNSHIDSLLSDCISYIESQRSTYGLLATKFENPNIFVMGTVTVFFETELDSEATVGVEFVEANPYQLIIGD